MPDKSSWASLVAQVIRSPPAMQETWVLFLGQEDPLEKGTATHSPVSLPGAVHTEEPGRVQSRGS